MKKKFLEFSNSIIIKYNPTIKEDDIEIIDYGLEGVYLTFSKLFIILIISFILGITREMLIILIFYNIIRFSAFGIHASKSIYCLSSSILFLIGGVYICNSINLSLILKFFISCFCIVNIYLYAPADTHKRPLINKKKRKYYKVISLFNASIFSILIVVYNESIISNYLLFSMIVAIIMIHPFTYKVFNMPYANYKNYKYGESS